MLNTNGKSKLKNIGLQFFADPASDDLGNSAPDDPVQGNNPNDPAHDETAAQTAAELNRLRAELVKQKNALDNATKEAASYKKQLRAKQTNEEAEAEAARERQEAMEAELAELRKQSAMGSISKRVLSFIGDEQAADSIAEALYGAEDIDTAIDAISKAWAAKEKELRLEFSKLPPPASGGNETTEKKDAEQGHRFGKAKMAAMQSSNEGLKKFMK